jgi:hypothetical protein
MENPIRISDRFPDSLERSVLLEALKVFERLRQEGIDVILCGGWVPFLKELVRRGQSDHKMSVDIDILLPPDLFSAEKIDALGAVLMGSLAYGRSRKSPCRLEKEINQRVIELDLIVSLDPADPQEMIRKLPGGRWDMDAAIADGGPTVLNHLEVIEIVYEEDQAPKHVALRIPDAVGFFILKSAVTYHREKSKDAYDLYYYCAFSDELENIRQKLRASLDESAVRAAISRVRQIFKYPDSKWVDMVLDHLGIQGEMEREREAHAIVKTVMAVVADLLPPGT